MANKPAPGVWAYAGNGQLVLWVWSGYDETFAEALLIEVQSSTHTPSPLRWHSEKDIQNGGVIIARRPATSSATGYPVPFSPRKNRTYWVAAKSLNGTIDHVNKIDNKVFEELESQRDGLNAEHNLEWIAVGVVALVVTLLMRRGPCTTTRRQTSNDQIG